MFQFGQKFGSVVYNRNYLLLVQRFNVGNLGLTKLLEGSKKQAVGQASRNDSHSSTTEPAQQRSCCSHHRQEVAVQAAGSRITLLQLQLGDQEAVTRTFNSRSMSVRSALVPLIGKLKSRPLASRGSGKYNRSLVFQPPQNRKTHKKGVNQSESGPIYQICCEHSLYFQFGAPYEPSQSKHTCHVASCVSTSISKEQCPRSRVLGSKDVGIFLLLTQKNN